MDHPAHLPIQWLLVVRREASVITSFHDEHFGVFHHFFLYSCIHEAWKMQHDRDKISALHPAQENMPRLRWSVPTATAACLIYRILCAVIYLPYVQLFILENSIFIHYPFDSPLLG